MIIAFKEAPELGRLKVVSDDAIDFNSVDHVCKACAMESSVICTRPKKDGFFIETKCLSKRIHFVLVNQND